MDRRSIIKSIGGLSIGATTGMAGCLGGQGSGGENQTETPTSTGGGGETQTTELPSSKLAMSHYPAITNFTSLVTARQKGLFEDAGMVVDEVVSFGGGGDTVRGLTTGGIGLGGAALSAQVKAFQSGAPLKVLGLMLSTTDIQFHTRPDAPFEKIQDMKGESIGVSSPGSSGEAVLIRSLQEAEDISLDDVKIKYTGGFGETFTQLSEGEIEAGWVLEPVATQWVNNGRTKPVFRGRDHVNNYTQFTIAASEQVINNKPDLVKAYVRGIIAGNDYTKQNPEESAKIWGEVADVPDDLAVSSLKAINPKAMFNVTPKKEILQSTAKAMIAQGTIDEQPNWDELLDQSFLPESKRADGF